MEYACLGRKQRNRDYTNERKFPGTPSFLMRTFHLLFSQNNCFFVMQSGKTMKEKKTQQKKKWHSPKVQVMDVRSNTADGTGMGGETIMMGMVSKGS